LIKEHLFGVLAREVTMDELEVVMGIGPYLEPADAANWINPLVAVGVAPRSHPTALVKRVRDVASDAMYDTSPEVVAAVFARIDLSIRLNEARGRTETVELLKGFRLEIDPEIPF
jgi:class 3 adenylate cyclase